MENTNQERSDFEKLSALLEYNPEDGLLTWKTRSLERFNCEVNQRRWNTRYAGKPAGSVRHTPEGKKYMQVTVAAFKGAHCSLPAHRIAYLLMEEEWPPFTVDHIDGNGLNNKWDNLRPATLKENSKNMRKNTKNTSGVVGVAWDKSRNKWLAFIKEDRKSIHLGRFTCFEEAVAVRKAAEISRNFHPNHGSDRPL